MRQTRVPSICISDRVLRLTYGLSPQVTEPKGGWFYMNLIELSDPLLLTGAKCGWFYMNPN